MRGGGGGGVSASRQARHLTAVAPLPHSVYRCKEAVVGDDKLGVAIGGGGQVHLKGAPLQGGARVTQLQGQPGTRVAGPIIADDVAEGYHMGRLNLPHALAPPFSLQAVNPSLVNLFWLP